MPKAKQDFKNYNKALESAMDRLRPDSGTQEYTNLYNRRQRILKHKNLPDTLLAEYVFMQYLEARISQRATTFVFKETKGHSKVEDLLMIDAKEIKQSPTLRAEIVSLQLNLIKNVLEKSKDKDQRIKILKESLLEKL